MFDRLKQQFACLRSGLRRAFREPSYDASSKLDLQYLEDRVLYSATPIPNELVFSTDSDGGNLSVSGELPNAEAIESLGFSEEAAPNSSSSSTDDYVGQLEASLAQLDDLLVGLSDGESGDKGASEIDNSFGSSGVSFNSVLSAGESTRELIVIDLSLRDWEDLVTEFQLNQYTDRDFVILQLDRDDSGVDAISEFLEQTTSRFDAIHLVTHGFSGGINLGEDVLTSGSLSDFAGRVESWRQHFTSGADLLLYGCSIAESQSGIAFVDQLADLLQVDILASTDATGARELGGDWDLEYGVGETITSLSVNEALGRTWQNLLLNDTVRDNFSTAAWTNNDGSALWVSGWNEIDAAGNGVLSGDFQIIGSQLQLAPGDISNTLSRQVNLAGAQSATLTFDFDSTLDDNMNLSGIVLEVSSDGTNWTLLDSFTESQNIVAGSKSFNLTAYMSAQTTVRFSVSTADSSSFQLYIDNFQIAYSSNTAPILNSAANPVLSSVSEGSTNPAGTTVAALIEDGSITDLDGMAVEAIAITGLNTSIGTFQYSPDGGTSWLTIDAAQINSQSNELALLLGPTAQLRLVPFGDLCGSIVNAITFRAWDQTTGSEGQYFVISSTGGNSSFSTASDTVSVSVTAINDLPNFLSGDGMVTTAIGTGTDVGRSVIVQPDGKIVVGGFSMIGSAFDFAMVRYNADGSLDASFGNGGIVTTDIGLSTDYGVSAILQPNGKIVLGGSAWNGSKFDFALVRYDATGTLDNSFGIGGMVTTAFGVNNDFGQSVSIQPDGKIVIAGYTSIGSNLEFALARYDVAGALDTSFGNSGIVTTGSSSIDGRGFSVSIQADGKILVGGDTTLGGKADVALVRFNVDGSLDSSFGTSGLVRTDVGAINDQGRSVTVQSDGKILVAGYSTIGSTNDFMLVRYNSNGSLDNSFGSGGAVTTAIGMGGDIGSSVTMQPDGKILVAGYADISGSSDFALVRYNANGTLDSFFGTGGMVTTAIGTGTEFGFSVSVQPDGKIVVGGQASVGLTDDFALVRYNSNGSLDTSFDSVSTETLGGTVNYTEDGSPVVLDNNVMVYDVELSSGNFNGAALTLVRNSGQNVEDIFSATGTLGSLVQGGNLTVNGINVGTVGGNSDGILYLVFNSNATNSLVNSVMQQIAYSNSSNNPPTSVQISWLFSDGNNGAQGAFGALVASGSVTVGITATNDAPLAISDMVLAVEAGGVSNSISGVDPVGNILGNDGDPDTSDTIAVTGVSAGVVSLANGNVGLDVVGIYGVLNVAADGTYTYTVDNGKATVQALRISSNQLIEIFSYTVSDIAGLSSTAYVTVTISGANDSPHNIAGTLSIAENSANGTAVGTVTGQDVDAGESFTYSLIDNAAGRFAINGSTGLLTVANGSLLDYETSTVHGIIVRVTDSLGDFLDKSMTVNVTDVAQSINLDASASPTLGMVLEGATNPSGITVASMIVDGSITATDGVAVESIAITAVNASLGTWQYSLDGGTNWLTIQADLINSSTNQLALLLGPTAQLRLIPFGDLNGSVGDAITFRAWNQTTGSAGAYVVINATGPGTSFSSVSDTVSIQVAAVNDAPTFLSGDGIVTIPIGAGDDAGYNALVQPDGKILIAGTSYNGTQNEFALMRFNVDGSLDTSFGGGTGRVVTSITSGDNVTRGLTLQSDGKILLAGFCGPLGDDWALLRFNSDGTPDTTFSGDGRLTLDFGGDIDRARSVVVQADGKIVVGGVASVGTTDYFAVARYNSNGTLDTTFSGDGKFTRAIGDYAQGWNIAVQPDSKIVLGGYALSGGVRIFSLIRLNASGTLDTSFNTDGIVTTNVGSSVGPMVSMAMQSDGKILIGGTATVSGNDDFALLRYDASGSLDASFGTGGKVTTAVGTGVDSGYSVSIQADGKILVAGLSSNGINKDFAIVRYSSNGSLDTSFGASGKFTLAIGPGDDVAYRVIALSDGRILVAGTSSNGANNDFAIIRLNANGSLDTTFDLSGTLGGTLSYTTGTTAVVLDSNVRIFDSELSSSNNFDGATLTLSRFGSANSGDQFSGAGVLGALTQGGNLIVQGVAVGSVTRNSGGVLTLAFNSNATTNLVNSTMQNIAYHYVGVVPPSPVQIQWTFNDGNTGVQGSGGELTAAGSVTVTLIQGNSKPVALPDQYQTDALTKLQVASPSILANDSDPDGNSLTSVLVSGPSRGVLNLQPDGRFTYEPDPTYVGVIEFVYRASDGSLVSDSQTVTITIVAPPSISTTREILSPSSTSSSEAGSTVANSASATKETTAGSNNLGQSQLPAAPAAITNGAAESLVALKEEAATRALAAKSSGIQEGGDSSREISQTVRLEFVEFDSKSNIDLQVNQNLVGGQTMILQMLASRLWSGHADLYSFDAIEADGYHYLDVERKQEFEVLNDEMFFQAVTPIAVGTAVGAGITLHLVLTSQIGTALLSQSTFIVPLDPLTVLDTSAKFKKSKELEDQLFEVASSKKARMNG